MPFSWSIDSTHTIVGNSDKSTKLTVDNTATKVYFINEVGQQLYEWDGTTFTDLEIDTFLTSEGTNSRVVDLQWFGLNLYIAYNKDLGSGSFAAWIGKWNGGTSWSAITELLHEGTPISRSFFTETLRRERYRFLEADSARMVAVTGNNFQSRLFASTDGTTWALQTEGGAGVYHTGYYYMAGQDKVRTRGLIVAEAQDAPVTIWRETEHNTGDEWDLLSASAHSNHFFGRLDTKSFYQHKSGSNYTMRYSTDHGVNLTSAGGPTITSEDRWLGPYDLHADVQILAEKHTTTVYVWNSATNNWDSDSTVGDNVDGFFIINNELFALCDSGTNSVRFYSGGAVAGAGGATHLIRSTDIGSNWSALIGSGEVEDFGADHITSLDSNPDNFFIARKTSTISELWIDPDSPVNQSNMPINLATPDAMIADVIGLLAIGSDINADPMIYQSGDIGATWEDAEEDEGPAKHNINTAQITSLRWGQPCDANVGNPDGVVIGTDTGQTVVIEPGDPGDVLTIPPGGGPPVWTPGGGGSTTFDALTDTPGNKAGQGGKLVAVNVAETDLEYIPPGSGTGAWPADSKAMIDTTEYGDLPAAVSASSPGDTIKLGPGLFDLGTGTVVLSKANVKIKGTGINSTKITSDVVGIVIAAVADGISIEDLHVENTSTGALVIGVGLNTSSTTIRISRVKSTIPNNAAQGYPFHHSNSVVHLNDCIGISSTTAIGYGLLSSGGNGTVYVRDGEYGGDDGDIASAFSTTIKLAGPRLLNDRLIGGNNQGYWAGTAAYGPARINSGNPVVNAVYNSLTYDLYQRYQIYVDIPNDTYFADGWIVVHNETTPNRPDCGRQLALTTDPFTHYLRVQSKAANTQFGVVHPFWHADIRPLRETPLSLSFEAWGSNVVNVRAALIYWTGSADIITSAVVNTWGAGNPTLASNWFYATTPTASTGIGATPLRFSFPNFVIPNTATNFAIFIWTPDLEANGDWLNIARVQLEPSTISTNFRSRLFADELRLIQSMVSKSYSQGVVPGTLTANGLIEFHTRAAIPASTSGTLRHTLHYPVTMRQTPTLILYDYTAGIANAVVGNGVYVRTGCTAEIASSNEKSMGAIIVDSSSGNAIALDDIIVFHWYAEALL